MAGARFPRLYNMRWVGDDEWHFGVYFVHPDNPPESHFLEAIEAGKKNEAEHPSRAGAEYGVLPAIWTVLEASGYRHIADLADEVVETHVEE
jgi:hypothetical protein